MAYVNETATSIGSDAFGEELFRSYYTDLSLKFANYHENPWNILFHLITTPMGFIGVMSLIRVATNSSTLGMALASFYILTLIQTVPLTVLIGTAALCFVIMMTSRYLQVISTSSYCQFIYPYSPTLSYVLSHYAYPVEPLGFFGIYCGGVRAAGFGSHCYPLAHL